MLSEVDCTPRLQTQRPPTLPINMDDKQLDELFASCMPRLKRTARQLLRSPQDSEDAMQEGLLLALRNLNQFEGRSTFSTWLHSIVRNAARTHVRRMKCRPQCSSEEDLMNGTESTLGELFVDPSLSPEEECARRERSRILREAVQELPPGYRSAMRLCDVDGVDPTVAAQTLGITASALKVSLFRARRLACRRIRQRCSLPYECFPKNEHAGLQRTIISRFGRTVGPDRDSKRSVRERYPIHLRVRKKRDLAGGKHEHGRKRPCLWKHSLAASARIPVHSTDRSAC